MSALTLTQCLSGPAAHAAQADAPHSCHCGTPGHSLPAGQGRVLARQRGEIPSANNNQGALRGVAGRGGEAAATAYISIAKGSKTSAVQYSCTRFPIGDA